jgi:hypothetical protein
MHILHLLRKSFETRIEVITDIVDVLGGERAAYSA